MVNIYIIAIQFLLIFFSSYVSSDTIRFASIDYCPFSCNPAKEESKEGIMTDVVRAAFEEAGYNIQIEMMPYARAVKAVRDGKYDGILVVGKKYAPDLIYPQKPTITQRMMFMVKPNNNWRYTDHKSLMAIDATMVVIKGFDYGDDNINNFVSAKPKNLVPLYGSKTTERGLELLHLDRVGTYIEGELIALYNIGKYGYSNNFVVAGFSAQAFEDYTGFNPHSPNAAKYAQLLSDKISQLQKSGELKRILEKYGITKELSLGHLIDKK